MRRLFQASCYGHICSVSRHFVSGSVLRFEEVQPLGTEAGWVTVVAKVSTLF